MSNQEQPGAKSNSGNRVSTARRKEDGQRKKNHVSRKYLKPLKNYLKGIEKKNHAKCN